MNRRIKGAVDIIRGVGTATIATATVAIGQTKANRGNDRYQWKAIAAPESDRHGKRTNLLKRKRRAKSR